MPPSSTDGKARRSLPVIVTAVMLAAVTLIVLEPVDRQVLLGDEYNCCCSITITKTTYIGVGLVIGVWWRRKCRVKVLRLMATRHCEQDSFVGFCCFWFSI